MFDPYPNLTDAERQAGPVELRRLLNECREKFIETMHGLAQAEMELEQLKSNEEKAKCQ